MRLLVQRVRSASVEVAGRTVGAIGPGLMALVGFGQEDGPAIHQSPAFEGLARKLLETRLFPAADEADAGSSFQLSVREYGGEILLVPQFTLYANCRKGRRPSFSEAGDPAWAAGAFQRFVSLVDESHACNVSSGVFGA
ncbi:MAG: D-aminoacyl-tRNA deacylase, partial [Desulfovibrionaceae bacterium]|nr:D-aminoacyl-tRNA deacylase [Desulfovibrionaceae bacterium]